jgi:hypothetical protein
MSNGRTHFDPSDLLVALSLRRDELENTQFSRLKFVARSLVSMLVLRETLVPSLDSASATTANPPRPLISFMTSIIVIQNYDLFARERYGVYIGSPLL